MTARREWKLRIRPRSRWVCVLDRLYGCSAVCAAGLAVAAPSADTTGARVHALHATRYAIHARSGSVTLLVLLICVCVCACVRVCVIGQLELGN